METLTKTQKELPATAKALIDVLLTELGEPQSDSQIKARQAFEEDRFNDVRCLGVGNPSDPYIKALGYMCSIPKMPPTLPVLVSEAMRSAAESSHQRQLAKLGSQLESILVSA
ncbi:MAG: hypothetical protein AAGF93_01720 [Cyanobacteria bacterium P01_H01_bin.105]